MILISSLVRSKSLLRVVVLLGLCMLLSCGVELPKERPRILKAVTENTGDGLDIKNDNRFDWHNVTFRLDTRYECSRAFVGAGKVVHVKYSEFKDKNGNRFPEGQFPSKYFIGSDEGTGPS